MSNREQQINRTPVQERYRVEREGTLLDLIMEKSNRSRTATKKLLDGRFVTHNGMMTTREIDIVKPGDVVAVHRGSSPLAFSHPLVDLIWENAEYVVIYKEDGIPTVNTARKRGEMTAFSVLTKHYKQSDPRAKLFMLNRLDRSTAGFIMFAKTLEAQKMMQERWGDQVTRELYVACIEGRIPDKEFSLETTSGEGFGKTVEVDVMVDKSSDKGRMHVVQIAVKPTRLYSLRRLFGDNKFGIFGDVRSGSHFKTKKKIALRQIGFDLRLPGTGQNLSFERPYPTHFFQLLRNDK